MKEQIEKLEALVANMKAEAEKVDAGNKAAGTRLRNFCQDGKELMQDIRKAVLAARGE